VALGNHVLTGDARWLHGLREDAVRVGLAEQVRRIRGLGRGVALGRSLLASDLLARGVLLGTVPGRDAGLFRRVARGGEQSADCLLLRRLWRRRRARGAGGAGEGRHLGRGDGIEARERLLEGTGLVGDLELEER